MKNSINDLRNQFSSRQLLTNNQLFAIKGGDDGEDKRRDDDPKRYLPSSDKDPKTDTTTPRPTVVVAG